MFKNQSSNIRRLNDEGEVLIRDETGRYIKSSMTFSDFVNAQKTRVVCTGQFYYKVKEAIYNYTKGKQLPRLHRIKRIHTR